MRVLQLSIYEYFPLWLHSEDIKKNHLTDEGPGGYHGEVEQSRRLGCVCHCLILEPSEMSAWLVFVLDNIFIPFFFFFLSPDKSFKKLV